MTRLTEAETDAALEGAWPAPVPRIIFAEPEPDDPDWERYIVRDVWLSEREFEDLPEHDGF